MFTEENDSKIRANLVLCYYRTISRTSAVVGKWPRFKNNFLR